MSYPTLKEGFLEWEIIINPDLDFFRVENWKHGIKRYWGYDYSDKSHKLMRVIYPKSNFSRNDMKRILPKYKDCKLCNIGKKFIKGKNNTSINMNLSIIDLLGKIPKIGSSISRNRYFTEPIVMQVIAAISRAPIAFYTTDFGKRLISFFAGLIGTAGVHYLIKNRVIQGEWASFFANYIASSAEPEARKEGDFFGVKDDWNRLKLGIKTGNFGTIANSMFTNISTSAIKRTIQGTLQGYGQKFKGVFNTFKGRRLRITEGTMPIKRRFGNVKYAEDYGYEDKVGKRFRDISAFGSGFRTQRRLRESGDAVYAAITS